MEPCDPVWLSLPTQTPPPSFLELIFLPPGPSLVSRPSPLAPLLPLTHSASCLGYPTKHLDRVSHPHSKIRKPGSSVAAHPGESLLTRSQCLHSRLQLFFTPMILTSLYLLVGILGCKQSSQTPGPAEEPGS